MTEWLARMMCRWNSWACERRGGKGWLERVREESLMEGQGWGASSRTMLEQQLQAMKQQLGGLQITMAAIIANAGGRLRVAKRHFSEVDMNSTIQIYEDASHRSFRIVKKDK